MVTRLLAEACSVELLTYAGLDARCSGSKGAMRQTFAGCDPRGGPYQQLIGFQTELFATALVHCDQNQCNWEAGMLQEQACV